MKASHAPRHATDDDFRVTAVDDDPNLCTTWHVPTLEHATNLAEHLTALTWQVAYGDSPLRPAAIRVEIDSDTLPHTLIYTSDEPDCTMYTE